MYRETQCMYVYIYIITISPPYFLSFTHQAAHVAGLIRLEPRDRWLCRTPGIGRRKKPSGRGQATVVGFVRKKHWKNIGKHVYLCLSFILVLILCTL